VRRRAARTSRSFHTDECRPRSRPASQRAPGVSWLPPAPEPGELEILLGACLVADLTERAQRRRVIAQASVGEAQVIVDDACARIEAQRGLIRVDCGAIAAVQIQ